MIPAFHVLPSSKKYQPGSDRDSCSEYFEYTHAIESYSSKRAMPGPIPAILLLRLALFQRLGGLLPGEHPQAVILRGC